MAGGRGVPYLLLQVRPSNVKVLLMLLTTMMCNIATEKAIGCAVCQEPVSLAPSSSVTCSHEHPRVNRATLPARWREVAGRLSQFQPSFVVGG